MTTDWSLPKSYRPYHKIIICGNMLVGVMIPFEINGNVPILIGTNRKPKVWLYAPAGEPDSLWQPVVKANRSLHTAILVKGVGTKTLSIVVGDVKVLKLIDQADGTPEVTHLDPPQITSLGCLFCFGWRMRCRKG